MQPNHSTMKKFLLSLFIFCLAASASYSQALLSITPNYAFRGQSLTTTVTGTGFFFTMGSYPGQWGNSDIFFERNGYYIYPSGWSTVIDDDNVSLNWNILPNAPIGNYVVEWDQFFWNQYQVPGGISIGDAFIQGNVFWDSDSSLTQNGAENGMSNQHVMLLPDSISTYTSTTGEYALASTFGNKSVKVIPTPLWNVTTLNPVSLNVNAQLMPGNNFGLKGVTDVYSVDISITSAMLPRCFLPATYYITYTNTGTVTTHGQIRYNMSNLNTFVSSAPAPNSSVGNSYFYDYTNLQPGETRIILITCNHPGPFNTATNSVSINAQDPSNNIVYNSEDFITQSILCAYDPNDKSVSPEGVQAPHYTLMSDTLDFIIRFQNTGNDTAFNVMILDTLNKNILDLSTFQIIASSHPVIVDQRTNGRTTFTFNNILLPDSNVNEPGSHGFVRYRCRIKTGLPNNTVLNNTAHIYFDLNPAIVTNTTLNTLVYQIPVGISEQNSGAAVQLYPNPVTNTSTIAFENPDKDWFRLKVYDNTGRLIYIQQTIESRMEISKKILKPGLLIYELMNLKTGKSTAGKFVVN